MISANVTHFFGSGTKLATERQTGQQLGGRRTPTDSMLPPSIKEQKDSSTRPEGMCGVIERSDKSSAGPFGHPSMEVTAEVLHTFGKEATSLLKLHSFSAVDKGAQPANL